VVPAAFSGSGCQLLVEFVETDTSDEVPDGAIAADSRVDGALPIDADVECTTWAYTPVHFDPCEIQPPNGALVLTPGVWTYDTNSGALTDPNFDATFPASSLEAQSGGPEVRVLSADAIIVQADAELRATGRRPLILVSWSTFEVHGVLDVSSRAALAGAGAHPDVCPAADPGADEAEGAGGGGGGGFGDAGADGGTGYEGAAAAGTGSAASATPVAVRGGCAGASGGNPTGGHGGSGGGALQLTARTSIVIDGTLHAGGAGGGGAEAGRAGGGGGGSGGFLGLQAPLVTVEETAVLAANGGGGGGGCDNKFARPGEDGHPDAIAALGGDGEGQGEPGGPGGFTDVSPGAGLPSNRGGGGGGGGVGYVRVWADTFEKHTSAVVSPDAIEQ
jgi:hypothetical protein